MVAGTMVVGGVAATRAGEQLLEAAVREHARLVYRVTYSILRNHHDAEDATQETFVRALRYRTKLGEIDDIRAWLARIAWRVAVDDDRFIAQQTSRPTGAFDPGGTLPWRCRTAARDQ